MSGNPVIAINIIYPILSYNCNVETYRDDLFPLYQKAIRIIIDDYLPNNWFKFK